MGLNSFDRGWNAGMKVLDSHLKERSLNKKAAMFVIQKKCSCSSVGSRVGDVIWDRQRPV